MKKLVIVESPAKAKTIATVLGQGYLVRASFGHVRDLPDDALGVDIEHNFKPTYHLLRRKSKTLKELRAALEGAGELYLATDPDREGEAIAWHLVQALRPKCKIQRVTFHAITPAAVRDAFAQPRPIDMRLVEAQQARRVLDRLVGYQVSPLLWRSTGGKSAGRVQSVALRLVVERERDIRNFVPVEYWTIEADLAKRGDRAQPDRHGPAWACRGLTNASRPAAQHFLARLVQLGDKKVGLGQAIHLKTKAEADQLIAGLQGAVYRVKGVKHERKPRKPWPPFTTSTLQQAASARLRLSPAETMKLAQELYEGVNVGGGNAAGKPVGLITYMRTDSTAVSPEAQAAARKLIADTLGPQYLPDGVPQYKTKVKNAQEAHEAIRPTDVGRYPNTLKSHLSERQFQLYDLIWRRFVASQMAAAIYDVTTVEVVATADRLPPSLWRAIGRVLIFDGFLRVWQELEEKSDGDDEWQTLPMLAAEEVLDLLALLPKQRFTQPPPHYSESALVKALEERGIGRPSTYAAILKTLRERAYVALDKRVLSPTPLGEATCDALLTAFPEVMDYQFTAEVEDWLDDVSRGERDWVKALQTFYGPFVQALQAAPAKMAAFPRQSSPPAKAAGGEGPTRPRRQRSPGGKRSPKRSRAQPPASPEPDSLCPRCGSPMIQRTGPHGQFLGCTRYPACKGTRKLKAGASG